jgi:hypothetical protein
VLEAKLLLEQVIKLYNQERPHVSGNLVPEKVHDYSLEKGKKMEKLLSKKGTCKSSLGLFLNCKSISGFN